VERQKSLDKGVLQGSFGAFNHFPGASPARLVEMISKTGSKDVDTRLTTHKVDILALFMQKVGQSRSGTHDEYNFPQTT